MLCCNTTNKQNVNTETVSTETVDSTNVSDYDCLDLDTEIYLETAAVWKESWKFVNASYRGSDPKLYFSSTNLDTFRDENAQGIRMYYILPDTTSTVPSLALVNITNCEINADCEGNYCVLASLLVDNNGASEQMFITYDTFETYRDNWIAAADDINKEDEAFLAVYAYNYSWDKIMEAADSGDDGIWVQYGMRTLGPLDSELYIEDYQFNDKTGYVVYANVVYWSEPTNPDEDVDKSSDSDEQQSFDFAKPCPRYCPELVSE